MTELAIQKPKQRPQGLPWKDRVHDHIMAQDAILGIYLACGLNPPRFAWATSPKAMYLASRMLRQVQAGSAQAMISSLIPSTRGVRGDVTEIEAKRTLLTAMLDPNITTQSGAPMRATMEGRYGKPDHYPPAVDDLRGILRFTDVNAPGTSTPATYREQVIYPALYWDAAWWPVAAQAVAIMPFVKVCFLALPPEWTYVDLSGHLHCEDGPAMEWLDGFAVNVDRSKDERERALMDTRRLQFASGEAAVDE